MTELEKCKIAKQRGFKYNNESGEIIGINGLPIRKTNAYGYIVCSFKINYKRYSIYSHRLAWFLHYGLTPQKTIDHIDGNKKNNRIENLRDVSHQENQFNLTKAKGYSWDPINKKFAARIKLNNRNKFLGRFNTEEEARNAYLKAKEKYHVISN
jgi:hypothetical protein